MRSLALGIAAAASLTASITAPITAEAMTVQPVVIDLATAGRSMSEVIIVENTFDRPLAVELTMQSLELTEDGVHATGEDTGELAVFPPQAVIQPGERQNFRVQYVGDPELAKSKHFYVTVSQLPVQTEEGAANIQLLYNFQVLVSVAPNGARPSITISSAEIGRDAEGKPVPVIVATNASGAHGYLSRGRLEIVQRGPGGQELFRQEVTGPQFQQSLGYGLIGGMQSRRITLPMPLPSAEGTVTVRYTPDS
ncbi:MAG: molecular chaperone [Porphyrobacter sp.]|nr:molecular chaperone [Porphyrobacter sp.]